MATLFIDREHSRVNWRVEVETDHIGGLGLEVRIVAGHISPEAIGLKTGLAPDLLDVRLDRFPALWPERGCSTGWLPRWVCGAESTR